MNRYTPCAIRMLLVFLAAAAGLDAGEPVTMIADWNPAIQMISAEDFRSWPGVDSRVPLDVSAQADRTWLVWPGAVVSLDPAGRPDMKSLLTLHATVARTGREKWSPEGGVICGDGVWRSVDRQDPALRELDLTTGDTMERPWNGPVPDALHAGPGNALLTLEGSSAVLTLSPPENGSETAPIRRVLAGDLPPVTHLAVSSSSPALAWMEALDGSIRTAKAPEPGQPAHIDEIPLPDDRTVTGLAWAGDILVLAGPGRLTAPFRNADGTRGWRLIEDSRLPERWYRVRGGRDRLIIHSPETGTIVLAAPPHESPAGEDINRDFDALVEKYALDAGAYLEENGYLSRAESFYGWILPHIRAGRSRHPLAETWPVLESEAARRRYELRELLE